MYPRLTGKNVLITGASSGIGAACAVEFARAGSNVIITARRLERLEEIKASIVSQFPSVQVVPLKMDVRDRSNVQSAIASIPPQLRAIDIVVNNAGMVLGMETVAEVSDEAINNILDTNVKGLVYVTQECLKGMLQRNSGHVINIGSISGTFGADSGHDVYRGGGMYCASKHAVDALTRTLRMELVETPINVTAIDPGMVETEFSMVRFSGNKELADKVYQGLSPLTSSDVAEAVVFAASRPPNVQVASMTLLPTHQATVNLAHRTPSK